MITLNGDHIKRLSLLFLFFKFPDGAHIFVCPFCSFSHSLNSKLTEHIKSLHPEEREKRLAKVKQQNKLY
jgi:hypothetical protein